MESWWKTSVKMSKQPPTEKERWLMKLLDKIKRQMVEGIKYEPCPYSWPDCTCNDHKEAKDA